MPREVAKIHDEIIFDYYKTGKGNFMNNDKIVFAIHKNKYAFPAEIMLKTLITYSFGIKFACFLNRDVALIRNYFPKHSLFE